MDLELVPAFIKAPPRPAATALQGCRERHCDLSELAIAGERSDALEFIVVTTSFAELDELSARDAAGPLRKTPKSATRSLSSVSWSIS